MKIHSLFGLSVMAASALAGGCSSSEPESTEIVGEAQHAIQNKNDGSYNLHLEPRVRFNPLQPGANVAAGRALFGLHPTDDNLQDPSGALFEGFSGAAGRNITSNGRTCFSCHRGREVQFGLAGPLPLSTWIPLTDTLFTGQNADSQGDPDGLSNLDNLALVKYRPGRFNPQRPQSDPFRKVFFWRKSINLMNLAFTHGFLNDGRMRVMFETDRGAVFSHTQDSDDRFDDLFSNQQGADLEAFQFSELMVTDPVLLALRDPEHPLHQTLIDDPFYTVPIETKAQKRGAKVFKKQCMSCHNTPNVFNNLDNVEALGPGEAVRPVNFPAFGPSVARTFNIGISERNLHGLRFTVPLEGGGFETVYLPLVAADGSVTNVEVTFDIGLAATTGRIEDVGRFKVPQLRELVRNAPYFHDNSATTLEEVVDYFNSDAYNDSKDGQKYPVHLDAQERDDLLEFLQIL
jgi:cytochrome c1